MGARQAVKHMQLHVNWSTILAYRWQQHHLDRRTARQSAGTDTGETDSGAPDLLRLVAVGGLKDSTAGQAGLSLFARGGQNLASQLEGALHHDKSLLMTWSLRGSPLIFPVRDAALYTQALLPETEDDWLHFLPGVMPLLPDLEYSFLELLELARPALADILRSQPRISGKPLLDRLLADAIALELPNRHLRAWHLPSGLAPGQTTGQALASFLLRPLALEGRICLAERSGRQPQFADPAAWMQQPDWVANLQARRAAARPALIRRYLAAYGPATLADLAAWTGLPEHLLAASWSEVLGECVRVEIEENRNERYLLAADAGRLLASADCSPAAPIVSLLPAGDPYLQMPERDRLLPDVHWRRSVWLAAGSPGVILQSGRIVGLWRHRQLKTTLRVTVRLLEPYQGDRQLLMQALTDQVFGLTDFWSLHHAEIVWEKTD